LISKKSIPAGTLGWVIDTGNTGIKVGVEIYIEQMYAEGRELAVQGNFTLVAIDKHKKPVKIGK
jgi:acyl-CoA hydrolase